MLCTAGELFTKDETVSHELLQLFGEHLGCHSPPAAGNLVVAVMAGAQEPDDGGLPTVAEWCGGRVNRPWEYLIMGACFSSRLRLHTDFHPAAIIPRYRHPRVAPNPS